MKKKRVSELITTDIVRSWSKNANISITAGTGAGKSYWVKNILYLIAKERDSKILFLIHRSNCINQFQKELNKDHKSDTIKLMSYQKLETYYMKNNKFMDISNYDFIVCDEFHYFMSDASFNKTTDISLNTILGQDAVKIFMSATPGVLNNYFKNFKEIELLEYELPINFDFINKLYFFNNESTLERIIKDLLEETTDKAIIFMNNAEKAYRLFDKFKNFSVFNCSKNNSKYYKKVDKDKIENILNNETFEERLLITTTAMDSGINLIDNKLKHILINGVFDIDNVKQMIGRKRLQNDKEYINVYLSNFTNNQLGGMKTKHNRRIEKAKYFINNGANAYIDKYFKDGDKTDIVYDINTADGGFKKELNELMYYKIVVNVCIIDKMLGILKSEATEKGYKSYMAHEFNKNEFITIEEDETKMELKEYLNQLVGKKLFKEEQKELINKIELKVNGKQQKSYNKLNEGLKMLKLPYIIIPKKSGNTRYWIIETVEE